jgi:ADP-ribosylglycohydrolase
MGTLQNLEGINMSRIRNSVYGLALGDAFGFITERMRFPEIVKQYGDGQYLPTGKTLQVSDDTQMSIVLIDALHRFHGEDKNKPLERGSRYVLMNDFVSWMSSGKPRGAGKATVNSLKELKRDPRDPHAYGSLESKGSGTVMRAPWVGLCSFIEDDMLEDFSWEHSLITHNSASTAYSAYLTSLITRRLHEGSLAFGNIMDFALETAEEIFSSDGITIGDLSQVDEIIGFINRIKKMPEDWAYMSLDDIDVCTYTGTAGRGDMVLAAAIAIADAYGEEDPIQGIQRAMISDGDSDTIGALAGAFIGAGHDGDIWEDLPDVLEDEYRSELERIIYYLES